MSTTRHARLGLGLALAAGAVAAGSGCRCQNGSEVMQRRPQKPRYAVIAIRVYGGSQPELMALTEDLLYAATDLGSVAGVSGVYAYEVGPPSGHGLFLAGGYAVQSSLSIEELLDRMAEIEAKVRGPQGVAGSVPLVRLDLLWVEDVELETERVTLPHPAVLRDPWATHVTIESAGDYIRDARLGRRMEHVLATSSQLSPYSYEGDWFFPKLERKDNEVTVRAAAFDLVDIFPMVARTYAFACEDGERWATGQLGPLEYQYTEDSENLAAERLERIALRKIVPLDVRVDRHAGIEARLRQWLEGVRAAMGAAQPFHLRHAVVRAIEGDRVLGELWGAPEPPPRVGVELERIEVSYRHTSLSTNQPMVAVYYRYVRPLLGDGGAADPDGSR